jgi:hypothetical protein
VKEIIKQVLLATCVIGAPTCVYALPFQPNPQSFQNYINAMRWDDGSKIYFQNINNCIDSSNTDFYICSGGFATISNPMGTKICNLQKVAFQERRVWYSTGNCRYK